MLFTKWLSGVTSRVLRKRISKSARKVTRRGAARSENLESRIVPAIINIDLTAGVLTVDGDADANQITVSVAADVYTLQAGAGDTFNVTSDDTATASVSGTGTTLTIGALATDVTDITFNLDGGNDSLTLSSADDAVVVNGSDGADTITVNGVVTATLNGEGEDDQFAINAVLTGTIDGGDGDDRVQGTEVVDVTLTGAGATDGIDGDLNATASFDNIDALTGTGGSLTGIDDASTWTLSGTSSNYTNGLNSLDFTGFSTLQGGTGDDLFQVTSATSIEINGGVGNDTFDIDARLTGSADGQDGDDTLDGNLINNVTLQTPGADGFDGAEADVTSGFFNINHISANGGTLRGLDAAGNVWDLADLGTNLNTYTQTNSVTFDGFSVLQGGSDSDEFNINSSVAFNLRGGSGDDTFNLNAALTGSLNGEGDTGDTLQGTAVDNVTLTASGANGFSGTENSISGGFQGIDNLVGNGGTLTGISVASTWTLDGTAPTYNTASATLAIDGFTTLQGGSAVDIFNVTGDSTFDLNGGLGNDKINIDNASLLGVANGGGGNDTLDGESSTGALDLRGGDGDDVVIGGDSADNLDGGIGKDRLYGQGGEDTLTGGAGNDLIQGGDGTDRLVETVTGSAVVTNTRVTGSNGNDTISQLEEIELTGNASNNLLDASAYTLGAVSLSGGEGNDTLAGGSIFGDVLDGGDGTDLVKANVAGTVSLSDSDLVSSGITDALSNIELASLTGSTGDDEIDATSFTGNVTINGGNGNDTLTGAAGASALNGQNGNDIITGQAENDSLLGGSGDDVMDGGDGDDRMNGNDGHDTMTGGLGNDTMTGHTGDLGSDDAGRDSMDGGDGDDRIDGGKGNDTIVGGEDSDSIIGGAGNDSLEGNNGDDTINGNADADRIEGGEGNDAVLGGAGNDVLLGQDGDDFINSQGGNDTMVGGEGDDSMLGGAGNELIFGGNGNDTANGQGGNDTLIGDDGDDSLLGGAGNDLVLGGLGGDDTINGGAGKDTVAGGGDQDVIADPAKERVDNATHDDFFSLFDATEFDD